MDEQTHYADDATLAYIDHLERELAEEARLNGMGSEREAKLMAERDRAVQYAERLKTALEKVRFRAFAYRPDERQMRKILDIADDALDAKGPEGGL